MSKKNKSDECFDNCKYDGKPIKFYDKEDHYEIFFIGYFDHDNESNSLLSDLIVDLKEADKNKEIHIFINSYGGYVCTLTTILSMLSRFKHRVTICTGVGMSCGLMLWAFGHERYCASYTDLMLHDMSSFFYGKGMEMKRTAEAMLEIQKDLYTKCHIHDIFTPEEIKLAETTEVFVSGASCIERGVAYDISAYESRTIPSKKEVYEIDGSLFELKDNKYIKLNRSSNTYTYDKLVHYKKTK